ncbi:MAG TPA: hypothetical protein VN495_01470, partial [Candidatus Paceibacterota bacterium]|nr:hypothetical protein [Candidatus Paceibacterota bacterium]
SPYSTYSTPSYTAQPSYYSSPSSAYYSPFTSSPAPVVNSTPSIKTAQAQSQSQSLYNYTPNTNTNNNTIGPVTSTNTNTASSNPWTSSNAATGPVTSTSSTGPITNTNNPTAIASNGPISIQNTVNVVPVSRAEPQVQAQYTYPVVPSCTIYASNYGSIYGNNYGYNNYSQPVTLTWSSSNATSAYITPNVGTVQPSGSTTVYPSGYTTYTMTVSGSGGTATCQATANYSYATPYVAPTYVQPTYVAPAPVYTQPSVSLTQIPYTGFDFGPVGNMVYWLGLLAFALAGGYLMVYYRPRLRKATNSATSAAYAASSYAGNTAANIGNKTASSMKAQWKAIGNFILGSYSNGTILVNQAIDTMATPTIATSIMETISAPVVSAFSSYELPTIESNRMTSDSMIVDHSSRMPRIVIARA